MNSTHPQAHQDRIGSFSLFNGAPALDFVDLPVLLTTPRGAYPMAPVDFVYSWEEEFALVLDEREISWQYKPRTFAVEWDEEGNFLDSFTPDFYLPAFDAYVELVATGYRASSANARKVRLLREQHPEIRIELLNAASPSSIFETLS